MALIRVKSGSAAGASAAVAAQAAARRRAGALELCLACWRDYMQADCRKPVMAQLRLVTACDDASADEIESDPYESAYHADYRIGRATDAMIESLPRLHMWAIYKAQGMGQVWQFPHADFVATLEAALRTLETKLRGNAVTGVNFA